MASDTSAVNDGKMADRYLDQYKAYLADLGNVGSRYATVSGFYMSVISALLGVLALTESSKVFGQMQTPTVVIVCGFAIVLCALWSSTIRFYRLLFKAKFAVLKQMEEHLPHHCFTEEETIMSEEGKNVEDGKVVEKQGAQNQERHHLLKIERFVPWILALFFVALIAIRLWRHSG
jgi:hypothetical protein